MAIHKRGKVYYMDFIVRGIRVNKSTRVKNKVKALEVEQKDYDKLISELESKSKDEFREVYTLKEALDEVYQEKWKTQASGEQAYGRVVYLIKLMGNPKLDEIDREWLVKAKGKLKGCSPATQNRYMAHLRFILRYARDIWDMLDKAPRVPMSKETKGRTRVISKEEQEKLCGVLKAGKGRQWYWPTVADLVVFLCETGFRLSEALKLDERNFQTPGVIQLHPDQTKTDAARAVPMSRKAQEIIEKRGQTPFARIDVYRANRAFTRAKEAIGIDDKEFCLHACRHTFASRLLAQGAELYHIKRLLGHTVWATTERYSHFQTKALQRVVQTLDDCREILSEVSEAEA